MRVASYDNIKLEEIKKQLPTEEQFYQFPEPFYQLLNFTDFDVKIRRDFR